MNKAKVLGYVLSALTLSALPTQMSAQNDGYKLVWSDEFNEEGTPNAEVWTPEHGYVRNHEAQYYQWDNAHCHNGNLIIEARKGSDRYTSSSIMTKRSFAFRYGRMVVRARIPVGGGAWPAIWLLGQWKADSTDAHNVPWPSCGEIDVMECYPIHEESHILANACWGDDRPNHAVWNSKRIPLSHFLKKDSLWAEKYHVWRMDWDSTAIAIYLDDELLNRIPVEETINGPIGHYESPFSHPHYILLNLALGGDNGGKIDDSRFPLRYYIDYLRVYQKEE